MALLKFKRSAVPAKVPALNDLALGELAINTYDGKVYTKKDNGTASIVEVGGGGGAQAGANSDITSMSGITGGISSPDFIQFDPTATVTPAVGKLYFNDAEGGLSYTLKGGNVVQEVGQSQQVLVYNGTGATITKGQVVYSNGAQGQRPTVALALATSDATSARTLGIAAEAIANGAEGWVTTLGIVENINTAAFAAGAQLYLSGATAGALTATKPFAPIHMVYVARCIKSHATAGRMFVTVQNGYEMDELHDVSAQNPANNDGLFYNTSTSLWEKKSIATALGYTPANRAGDTFTGLVTVSGTGLSAAVRLSNTSGGRDWRVMQKDDGRFVIADETAGAERFTITSAGAVTALVDMRSPIFYDSNDTSFYVDPSSGSRLNTVSLNAGSKLHLVSLSDGNHYLRYAATGFSGVVIDGAQLAGHQGGELATNLGGDNWSLRWDASGNTFSRASSRAPIFYDSNNTAFYVDPATGSSLSGATFSDLITGRSSPSTDVNTANDTGSISIRGSTTTVASMSFHRTGAYAINMGLGTDNVFRIGGWSAQSNCLQVFGSGAIQALNDFRAPVFYDSNNTGYYIDPNSTSNIYRLASYTAAQYNSGDWNAAFQNTPAQSYSWHGDVSSGGPAGVWWFYESMRHANASNFWGTQIAWGWEDNANRMLQRNVGAGAFSAWVEYLNTSGRTYNGNLNMTGSIISTASDMRAPIFYDQNNTSFYLDAASTSFLNTVSMGAQTWRSDITWNSAVNINVPASAECSFDVATSGTWQVWDLTSNAPMIKATAGTNVEIGSAGSRGLYVYGSITASGNVTAYSDRRLKDNIEQITSALSKVRQLCGVTFTRIDLADITRKYAGLLAQDVQKALPEAVHEIQGKLAVDYNATIGLLVEAIKELEQQVLELKK